MRRFMIVDLDVHQACVCCAAERAFGCLACWDASAYNLDSAKRVVHGLGILICCVVAYTVGAC